MCQAHILVVDDDTKLRTLLRKYLTNEHFTVTEAAHPKEARELLSLFDFDAIIMDVMMPHQNGQDFVRALRHEGLKTPVLMLTAMGDIDNRITGLQAGADDYLGKPFDPRELVLRLQNLLKHSQSNQKNDVDFGPYRYQLDTHTLSKGDEVIALTTTESELLDILAARPNVAISREELGDLMDIDNERTIDVKVTRLRKKIEADIGHPTWIQAVRGKGYKLVSI